MSAEVFISDAVSSIILEAGKQVNESICEDIEGELGEKLSHIERTSLFAAGSTELIKHFDLIQKVVYECAMDTYHGIYEVSGEEHSEELYSSFLQSSQDLSLSVLYIMFSERMKTSMKNNNRNIFSKRKQ